MPLYCFFLNLILKGKANKEVNHVESCTVLRKGRWEFIVSPEVVSDSPKYSQMCWKLVYKQCVFLLFFYLTTVPATIPFKTEGPYSEHNPIYSPWELPYLTVRTMKLLFFGLEDSLVFQICWAFLTVGTSLLPWKPTILVSYKTRPGHTYWDPMKQILQYMKHTFREWYFKQHSLEMLRTRRPGRQW